MADRAGADKTIAQRAAAEWNGPVVRTWLESRVVAARADQVVAEKGGRGRQDDCDKANAEEMVCATLKAKAAVDDRTLFLNALTLLLDRDDYVWPGVYDDTRFDRHVRAYVKRLIKMAKLNAGFANVTHYQ